MVDESEFRLKPDSFNNSLCIERNSDTNSDHEIRIAKKDDFYMNIFSEINFGGGTSNAISINSIDTSLPGSYPIPRLTIDSEGKVGIGTTAPSAKLTIKGESPNKSLAVHIGYSSHYRYCFNDSKDPAFSRIKAGDQITIKGKKTTVKEVFINFLELNDAMGDPVFGPTYTSMKFKIEDIINTPFFKIEDDISTPKLVVSSDGNVGIGKVPDSGIKLDVNGMINATSLTVTDKVDGRDVSVDGATLDAHVGITKGNPHGTTVDDVLLQTIGKINSSIDITGDLTITGKVDGRDVSVDGATLDAHVGITKGNPHGTRATDVGALPDTGGMVNGDLNVTGKVTATSFVGLLPTHAHSANQITTGTISGVLTVNDKVGIGTTDMQYGWLTIAHDSVPLVLRETDQALDMGGLWRMVHDGGELRFDVYKPDSPIDFQWVLVMSNSRDVTLAANLTVENNAYKPGGGTWTSKSDLRYKKNVEPLTGALDLLLKLHGVYFEYREPEKNGNLTGKQMGLIAQEVEEVFPEWVGKNDDGYKTLSIRGFEALAIESFRDIHSVYENLKIKIKELENKINILEKNIK